MRKKPLITKEHYHIYNRGVDKRDIFRSKEDISRFVEGMINFNQIEVIGSLKDFKKLSREQEHKILSKPLVSIVAYCLNPNHFHFILQQLIDGGIAKFMQKLQAGYTSYFNIKNSRTGSLFQGTFKSNLISNESYLNKIIGYVNKNYKVHIIPKNKNYLTFASDHEYENNNFKVVSKIAGKRTIETFDGLENFRKHCDEIVSIIKEERGQSSLLEEDDLPASA